MKSDRQLAKKAQFSFILNWAFRYLLFVFCVCFSYCSCGISLPRRLYMVFFTARTMFS